MGSLVANFLRIVLKNLQESIALQKGQLHVTCRFSRVVAALQRKLGDLLLGGSFSGHFLSPLGAALIGCKLRVQAHQGTESRRGLSMLADVMRRFHGGYA